jgi:hypothetical protein
MRSLAEANNYTSLKTQFMSGSGFSDSGYLPKKISLEAAF